MKPIPAIYQGRIDYRTQDFVFEMRRALRSRRRRNASISATMQKSSRHMPDGCRIQGSPAISMACRQSSSHARAAILIRMAALVACGMLAVAAVLSNW